MEVNQSVTKYVFSLNCGQFLERFEQLWLLSRESLESDVIDTEAEKWGKKANTVASTGKVTGWMSSDIAITLPLGSDNKLTNISRGIPLIFEGKLVGGLGIAGGTVNQDKEIAKRVIQTIGSDLPKDI